MVTTTTDANMEQLDVFLGTLRGKVLMREIELDHLLWFSNLSSDKRNALMNNVDDKTEQPPTSILRLISEQPLLVDATDGSETILAAKDVFPGGIDSDFRNYGADEASGPMPETPTMVYEMAQNATFAQMFGSLSGQTESLCMTQSQIIKWVKTHPEHLRTGGYATFFLFRSKGSCFVADVGFGGRGRLGVGVDRFEVGDVWGAEYRRRLVVPQL